MTSEDEVISSDADLAAVDRLRQAHASLKEQIARTIVGQEAVVEQMLIALFARGHCLLEGVPGLAKTLLIHTLADCLSLSFSRIQFTPDLMPADVTGTEVLQEDRTTGAREFRFLEGPLFANVILADEINRTPPKTQAALLEAMQEQCVSVGRIRHRLPDPFFVLATQNPIEQEGTYPLPEAQQDRFLFKVYVRYPTFEQELEIARRTTGQRPEPRSPVLSAQEILQLQDLLYRVPITDHVLKYALALVRQTRAGEPGVPGWVKDWIAWGAGPRAVLALVLGSKVRALLHGRVHVACEDIAALAAPVLRHRLVPTFAASVDGVTTDRIVDRLLEETPAHADDLSRDKRFSDLLRA